MADADADLLSCDQCGATVYPEHLDKHKAGRVGGKLLCLHCLRERQTGGGAADVLPTVEEDGDEAPLAMMDDLEDQNPLEGSQIRQFGTGLGLQGQMREDFQRPLLKDSRNATRCRTFHAKLTDAAIAHLNESINDWVDEHPDIEIKFAMSNIGVVEGKHQDQHLIVTVFY